MVTKNISIENAKIMFRNFSGKEDKFNPAGRRNFCVLIPNEDADKLSEEGWNIRWLKPKDESEDHPQAYLQVGVVFEHFPPKIVLISGGSKTVLDKDSVDILDWAEIEKIDLIIRPYNWTVNNKVGIKAYVKSMYITLVEDEFEARYRDIPNSARSAMFDD